MSTPTPVGSGTPKIEKRKISSLTILPYGDTVEISGQTIRCEPSEKEIADAIEARRFETRNYQTDREALKAEWGSESANSGDFLATWQRLVTAYHARRIAHFVENGWDVPIEIDAKDKVTDGTHRIKAAIYKGDEEVEVIVISEGASR